MEMRNETEEKKMKEKCATKRQKLEVKEKQPKINLN